MLWEHRVVQNTCESDWGVLREERQCQVFYGDEHMLRFSRSTSKQVSLVRTPWTSL